MMSTEDEQDFDWDQLCVNPQNASLEAGRREGQEAGLEAGFREGKSIGRLKGIDLGMEIGFMRGFLQEVIQSLDQNSILFKDEKQQERVRKNLNLLSELIENFPLPGEIFDDSKNNMYQNVLSMQDDGDANDNDSEQNTLDISNDKLDLMGQMQAIRSKFKLLTVQLRFAKFSLKCIMDEHEEPVDKEISSEETIETRQSQSQSADW